MNRECGKGCIAEVPEGYSTNSDCLLRGSGFTFKPNWLIEGFLPKLTAEVFDRTDCPAWAKYAVLTPSGKLFFLEDAPYISKDEYPKRWISYDRFYPVEGSIFDATDWQNSQIERTETRK
jgi:hypothetical protein